MIYHFIAGEVSQLQEKLSQLTSELGGRDSQLNQLQVECDRVTADNEAKEYDLNKVGIIRA